MNVTVPEGDPLVAVTVAVNVRGPLATIAHVSELSTVNLCDAHFNNNQVPNVVVVSAFLSIHRRILDGPLREFGLPSRRDRNLWRSTFTCWVNAAAAIIASTGCAGDK
jgi:hypothetical protein